MLKVEDLAVLVEVLGLVGDLVDSGIIMELELSGNLLIAARGLQCHDICGDIANSTLSADSASESVGLAERNGVSGSGLELDNDGEATEEVLVVSVVEIAQNITVELRHLLDSLIVS